MRVHGIGFAIDESKFGAHSYGREKSLGFATCVPGERHTYVFGTEEDYNRAYSNAYYAITMCKAGWDCLRHYEIIAAGCVPFFVDLDDCPEETMKHFPKDLVKAASRLDGVDASARTVDFSVFPMQRYYELRDQLVDYARAHLTCRALACRVMESCGVPALQSARVLFLNHHHLADYQREFLLTGLKRVLGRNCIACNDDALLYTSFPQELASSIYGRGFNYTRVLPAELMTPQDEAQRAIAALEQCPVQQDAPPAFDLIVYGSWHRSQPHLDQVKAYAARYRVPVAVICGEDIHQCHLVLEEDRHAGGNASVPNGFYFVRELGTSRTGHR